MTNKSNFLILALLLCTMTARAQYNQVIASTHSDYKSENDIPYREAAVGYAQERCKLDVYYPTNAQDAPVVVWFHGGGIEGGEKHIDPQLRNSGLVVVAANYRLLPKAKIDDILDDAAAAAAWTYKNIAKYNGSRRKIFLAGHSAGGYLLDLIGLDKRWLAKYGVDADSLAALVPFSGQCVTHYNIRKQQGIPPLQATIDQYAPLTYVRADAPPIVIISGDRELELFGRYEEQAYFWRMLKLVGHKDVTLYEMQGYDHGVMPQPAYKILKDHIRRITAKMTSALPVPTINTERQAEYRFAWQKEYIRRDARIDDSVLHLGTNNGYYDLTAETGAMISQLRDFTVSVHYKVSSGNELDGYGHFLFAFSALAENWHHAIYRQQNHNGELFIDGKLIGRNDRMPILAEIFKDAPANCWIGRAPFHGDKYLAQTDISDFCIYTYAVSDKDMRQLMKQARASVSTLASGRE